MICELESINEYNNALTNCKNKFIFIDFYAEWCGPCKRIAPEIKKLSTDNKYSHIEFYKVDIDKVQELGELFNISSLPTFILLDINTKKLVAKPICGANLNQICILLNTVSLDDF